jgi:hypothetical protein
VNPEVECTADDRAADLHRLVVVPELVPEAERDAGSSSPLRPLRRYSIRS